MIKSHYPIQIAWQSTNCPQLAKFRKLWGWNVFAWNLKDEINQNYKITRMKCVLHETLGMKLVNTLNIRDEKCIFPLLHLYRLWIKLWKALVVMGAASWTLSSYSSYIFIILNWIFSRFYAMVYRRHGHPTVQLFSSMHHMKSESHGPLCPSLYVCVCVRAFFFPPFS